MDDRIGEEDALSSTVPEKVCVTSKVVYELSVVSQTLSVEPLHEIPL